MSEFKVGDRVEVSHNRVWGVGVITEVASWRVVFANGHTHIAAPHHLWPAPPEPPSLLEAAEAVITMWNAGRSWTAVDPMLAELDEALKRERAKQ